MTYPDAPGTNPAEGSVLIRAAEGLAPLARLPVAAEHPVVAGDRRLVRRLIARGPARVPELLPGDGHRLAVRGDVGAHARQRVVVAYPGDQRLAHDAAQVPQRRRVRCADQRADRDPTLGSVHRLDHADPPVP